MKRGPGLFLLVAIPVALFIALFWQELALVAGPACIVVGLGAIVLSFVPGWVGTDPATGNAPPSSSRSTALLLGGVLLDLVGLTLAVWRLTNPAPEGAVSHATLALLCQGIGVVLMFGLFLLILPRFVLPAQTRAERRQVRGRLWLYLLGSHGPVVMVKQGQRAAVAEEEEAEAFKPSVALVDTVSAIALERKFPVQQAADPREWRGSFAAQLYDLEKYLAHDRPGWGEVVAAGLYWGRWLRLVPQRRLHRWLLSNRLIRPRPVKPPRLARVEGPGLVFVEADELVHDTLDLRTQRRTRQHVKALTRDGIEVETTVTAIFRLQGPEAGDLTGQTDAAERNRPAYSFDRESAFRAVYGTPVAKVADDDAPKVGHWTDLPVFVAADIFRDLILTYTLDSLFHPTTNIELDFPLDDLRQTFAGRVKADPVLKERGIQVVSASFGRLSLPDKVAEQRVESWKADWARQSKETLAGGELQAARIIERARADAQYDLTKQMLATLKDADSTAVMLHFIQSLERASADPETRSLLPPETIQILNNWLNNLSKWLPPSPPSLDNPAPPSANSGGKA